MEPGEVRSGSGISTTRLKMKDGDQTQIQIRRDLGIFRPSVSDIKVGRNSIAAKVLPLKPNCDDEEGVVTAS